MSAAAPSRLALALEAGAAFPEAGRIAVFAPRAGTDLSALPAERLDLIVTQFPDHRHFEARGYACRQEPGGDYAGAVVFIPRAKALARDLIARAEQACPEGMLMVDGSKTDGIDSLLRAMRALAPVDGVLSKAHGKVFWLAPRASGAPPRFAAWRAAEAQQVAGGFKTRPGVFSADGLDPGTALLCAALPPLDGAHVVDLGAGWGALAAHVLGNPKVAAVDLVEADSQALDCARENITDPRARFHWADARDWQPEAPVDVVVTNPPFHTGRSADPSLGRAFIEAAARMLTPRGRLFLVANTHLAYESTLDGLFARNHRLQSDRRFKLFMAERPLRTVSRRRR